MKEVLKGIVVTQGSTQGKCKIIHTRKDFDKIQAGDILVTKNTDPSYVILFSKVSGIITDLGGVCSHAAIVSRELGIPCIVGARTATVTLKDGEEIILDADTGIIYYANE